jgi:hypothetical protein|tara:strand:+ start:338 stop:496 length:159 start_codon:yes stop_codon:yes gene_type:complete
MGKQSEGFGKALHAYLDIKSGTEVPAARNVYPITTSLIPATAPTEVAHHTMK